MIFRLVAVAKLTSFNNGHFIHEIFFCRLCFYFLMFIKMHEHKIGG